MSLDWIDIPWVQVFIFALITAIATGLGALPFFFIKNVSQSFLGKSNAAAAGLMLAASYNLIFQGYQENAWMTLVGMIAGVVLVILANRALERSEGLTDVTALGGKNKMNALLFLGVMTVHSFAEGVSVGVSFADTYQFGLFITIAIAVHNIPEGLAISLVMVPKGTSPLKAAGWSIFSSLPQPLMAVPAFLFVSVFREYLPFGLGFAAGAMIWMVFADLIPEALEKCEAKKIGLWVTIAIIAMSAFQLIIGE